MLKRGKSKLTTILFTFEVNNLNLFYLLQSPTLSHMFQFQPVDVNRLVSNITLLLISESVFEQPDFSFLEKCFYNLR